MNEETKKAGQIKKTEEEAKAAELSEESLAKVAGGGTFNSRKSGIKTVA